MNRQLKLGLYWIFCGLGPDGGFLKFVLLYVESPKTGGFESVFVPLPDDLIILSICLRYLRTLLGNLEIRSFVMYPITREIFFSHGVSTE